MSADLRPSHILACNFHPETDTDDENVTPSGVAEDSMDPVIYRVVDEISVISVNLWLKTFISH